MITKDIQARPMREEKYTLDLSEQQVLYYRSHPVIAVRDLLGIRLIWLQRITLNMIWFIRFPLLNISRGVSKTYLIAIAAVLFAMLYPGTKIGIIAPVFRQANYVFDAIEDLYNGSDYLQAATLKGVSRGAAQTLLRFYNKSVIEALPVGDGTKIRGRRYNCVVGDTLISTDKGLVKIKDIFNNRFNKSWRLYTCLGIDRIKRYIRTNNEPTKIITLAHGYNIEGTLDHPILTLGGYKSIDNLKIGDKVILKSINSFPSSKIYIKNYLDDLLDFYGNNDRVNIPKFSFDYVNEELAEWLGYIISEGTYIKGAIGFTNTDIDMLDRYRQLISKLFNIEYSEAKYPGVNKPYWNIYFSSTIIKQLMKFLGVEGVHSKYKETPWCILQSPKPVVKAFLRALFAGDGSIYINKRGIFESIGYSSSSPTLLYQLQTLLLNFGIISRVNSGNNGSLYNKDIEGNIRGFGLSIGSIYAEKFMEEIGFSCLRKTLRYENSNRYKRKPSIIKNNGEFELPIRHIIGSENICYDVGMENEHNFISNGIISHNCIFIDEYAQMDEMIIKLVVRPMLNIKRKGRQNKLIVASTAYYRWNHYWTLYLFYIRQMMRKHPDYGIAEFDHIDLKNTPDSPYQIDDEIIEMQKNDMTYEEFAMENLCLFPADTVSFISAKLIDQCTPKIPEPLEPEVRQLDSEPTAKYVVGVDCARVAGGDNFVITVLKLDNDKRKMVNVVTMNGCTFQEMVNEVRNVYCRYNVIRIHLGGGGGGLTLKDLLAERWVNSNGETMLPILDMDDPNHQAKDGMHIVRVVNEAQKKNNELYMNLKSELQHKRLLFPVDVRSFMRESKEVQDAYKEIIATKRELMVLEAIPQGMYHKFVVPAKYKKDRATALVMAIDAALEIGKVDKIEVSGELPVGLWV